MLPVRPYVTTVTNRRSRGAPRSSQHPGNLGGGTDGPPDVPGVDADGDRLRRRSCRAGAGRRRAPTTAHRPDRGPAPSDPRSPSGARAAVCPIQHNRGVTTPSPRRARRVSMRAPAARRLGVPRPAGRGRHSGFAVDAPAPPARGHLGVRVPAPRTSCWPWCATARRAVPTRRRFTRPLAIVWWALTLAGGSRLLVARPWLLWVALGYAAIRSSSTSPSRAGATSAPSPTTPCSSPSARPWCR